jgi:hypothetical protein
MSKGGPSRHMKVLGISRGAQASSGLGKYENEVVENMYGVINLSDRIGAVVCRLELRVRIGL